MVFGKWAFVFIMLVAGLIAQSWSGGFSRDSAGDLNVTYTVAGAVYSGGFLRDPNGNLVVCNQCGVLWQGGFLRGVNGELSIDTTATTGTFKGGFLLDSGGSIVACSACGVIWSGGFLKTLAGQLSISGGSSQLPNFGVYTSCEIDTNLGATPASTPFATSLPTGTCMQQDAAMVASGVAKREINYLGTQAYLTNTQNSQSLQAWFAFDASIGMAQYISVKAALTDSGGVLTGTTFNTTNSHISVGCAGGTSNSAVIACIAAVCNPSPGCAGWYLYDEPGCPDQGIGYCQGSLAGGNYTNVATLANYIATVSSKPILAIQVGDPNTSQTQVSNMFSYNNQTWTAPAPTASPFCWVTCPDTPKTGYDYYPYCATPPATPAPTVYCSLNNLNTNDIQLIAGYLTTTIQANNPSETVSFTGQAFSWFQETGAGCSTIASCPFPSQSQMQYERDLALYYNSTDGHPLEVYLWYYWPDITCETAYTGCVTATNISEVAAVNSVPFPSTAPTGLPTPSASPTPTPGPPALAQAAVVCSAGSSTCSLGSNPSAGDELVVVVTDGSTGVATMTAKDSHGNLLTQEILSTGCTSNGHCTALYDEIVPASTGTTVSFFSGGSPYNPNASAVYDIDNVTGTPNYAANGTGASGTSLIATISGVTNQDMQICGGLAPSGSTLTLALSNGTVTADTKTNIVAIGHGSATATASSTCTIGAITAGSAASIVYGDYP